MRSGGGTAGVTVRARLECVLGQGVDRLGATGDHPMRLSGWGSET